MAQECPLYIFNEAPLVVCFLKGRAKTYSSRTMCQYPKTQVPKYGQICKGPLELLGSLFFSLFKTTRFGFLTDQCVSPTPTTVRATAVTAKKGGCCTHLAEINTSFKPIEMVNYNKC